MSRNNEEVQVRMRSLLPLRSASRLPPPALLLCSSGIYLAPTYVCLLPFLIAAATYKQHRKVGESLIRGKSELLFNCSAIFTLGMDDLSLTLSPLYLYCVHPSPRRFC